MDRAAQKHAAESGDIQPAQLGQNIQRIVGLRPIDRHAAPDGVDFARQPRVGKARAAPGHALHGLTQKRRRHGAGRRRIADALRPSQQV